MAKKEAKVSWMQRYGMRYFAYLSKKATQSVHVDEIHVLNSVERNAILRVQRGSIFRQALAGAISAGISVVIGFMLWPRPGDWDAKLPWSERLEYYAWLYALSFLVTAVEIGYLYYDGLRSVHKLSTAAGLELFSDQDNDQTLAISLVRAALELPNPPDNLEGVNPKREISKVRLLVSALVYKFKATATNFIVKAVMRRVAGRSALRAVMEFASVPVFAFWNGLIAYWVIRQATIRAIGPSAGKEFAEKIYPKAVGYSEKAQTVAFQAIGAAIVSTVDLHPNLIAFMAITESHLGAPGNIALDDSALYLASLKELDPVEQEFALQVLALACILDGRIAYREKKLMRKALEICNYPPDLSGIVALKRNFVRGNDIVGESLATCLPKKTT